MSKATDSQTETETPSAPVAEAPKRRGRKRLADGGVSTPREVEVTCVALLDGDLVCNTYKLGPAGDRDNAMMLSIAKANFAEEHGVECDFATNPYYTRKGSQSTGGRRKAPVIDMAKASFTKKTVSVIHNKWNATARFVEGRDDAVFVIYNSHTEDPGKKNTPHSKPVWLSDLEIVEDSQPTA